ncbi:hypothetical protein MNBD_CHLOROFLEXI01-4762 [hydrothermal vent metagenome]|uniref:Glycerophosphoryl diester phosphodiesterase membrane domain-containing protein n=1 Tax=hydrothermal vent metagenome TaxID=652676 RepID=A0A3B0UJM4_9ZZZZ
MFQRLSNSWELVKASWRVLLADKELMLFPLVAFFASVLVMITFAVPTVLAGVLDSTVTNGELGIFSYIIAFLFYAVMYFVTIFSNTALVGAAMIRLGIFGIINKPSIRKCLKQIPKNSMISLNYFSESALDGGDPTVGDGFRIAFSKIGAIFGYAFIAATVGTILRMISERSGAIGKLVVSLVGFVWTIATFLVIPVLVVEDVGPLDAVKRSASLLRETWGEQIAGNLSVGLIFGLIFFLVILAGVPLIFAAIATGSVALIVTAVAFVVLLLVGISLVSSTLSGIYTAAVYRFATTGDTGGYFEADMVQKAFKQK